MQKNFKSFSQYITESNKGITITFGRLNPPTIGHGKLMEAVAKAAAGGPYRIYVSQSQDPKKNPLEYTQKIKYIRKMFPRHARSVILDKQIKNIFDVLTKIYEDGFNQVNLVVGSDRVSEFNAMANKYNGVKARHGFYNFEGGVNVISAGERDPDAEGVTGMSASKMRSAAEANDLQTFMKGLPSGFKEAKELFNDVRKGMGLNESHDFRTHIQLQTVSEEREAYVSGELFSEGDSVVITATEEVGTISFLGANYVIVETAEGKKYRKWISDVERLEDDVKDITLSPDLDRMIDRFVNRKKYAAAVKTYLGSNKYDLRKIAQMYAIDYRNLKKSVDKVLGEMNIMEGENVDRAKEDYEEAREALLQRMEREKERGEAELEALDATFERELEDAERRDEIEDEQETRRSEAEQEDDEEEQQTESVKSFKDFANKGRK